MSNDKRKISFTTVRVVREVMAAKSLTKAAAKLNISQPAVSTHLKRFEEAIGVAPMTRVGNEMIISSQEILEVIEGIIALEVKLLKMADNKKQSLKRFGACQYWGMPIVEGVENAKPLQNSYDMCIDCSKKLSDMLQVGELDLLARPIMPGEDPEFSQDLLLTWAGNFDLRQSYQYGPIRVILGNPMAPFGRSARDWLKEQEIDYKIVMECDNPSLLPTLCQNLDAITLVPARLADGGGFRFRNSFADRPNNIKMKLGLFYSERTVSYFEAEEAFKRFLWAITPIRRQLHIAE